MKVNIIVRNNGVGLDRDVDLISQALTIAGGFDITTSYYRGIPKFRKYFPFILSFDVNIFLERTHSRWFGLAKTNVLIPNQEHFPHRLLGDLEGVNHVLCKTRHSESIFKEHHPSTHFISFTSNDMEDASIKTDYQSFFHLAGKSVQKGTNTLLSLWEKNPHWPNLTIIQCEANAPHTVPPNVRLITDYITYEEIKRHLNSHGMHLCTSSSEGWGHYLVEAMSCQALIVTTDGPPMNEMISPNSGILVPWSHHEPRQLGTDWHIDPEKLEKIINELLIMPAEKNAFLEKRLERGF